MATSIDAVILAPAHRAMTHHLVASDRGGISRHRQPNSSISICGLCNWENSMP